jgi:hypothetical protein
MALSGLAYSGDRFIDAHLLMVLYLFFYTCLGIGAWRFPGIY